MGKIVVRIVTQAPGQASGGMADSNMLRPFKADIVKATDQGASQISGGVLPITQSEYDAATA